MAERKTKIEVTPEITRQIATRRAIGKSLRELEDEFGFSRPVINRVLSSDIAKAIIKGVVEDAVAGAVIGVRRQLADMTDLAMGAMRHHLEEQSLEAVKLYFKGLGIESQEKTEVQQQGITVILPGQAPPPKDVPNDVEV